MASERPKEHSLLMLRLKRTLTTDNFEDLKLLVKADDFGGFKDAELEKIKDVREMIRELEAKEVIVVGKYRKLKEMMRSIGNVAVIGDIDQTEKLLYEKGYGIASGAANTEMTSKRVSQPHKHRDNSSDTETTSDRVSGQHQPLDNSSGYAPTSPRVGNKRQTSAASGLDDKKFQEFAMVIGKAWKNVATFLSFNLTEIQEFEHNNSEINQQAFNMFVAWWRRQSDKEDPKKQLKEAFELIHRNDMVKMLSDDTELTIQH